MFALGRLRFDCAAVMRHQISQNTASRGAGPGQRLPDGMIDDHPRMFQVGLYLDEPRVLPAGAEA